MGLGGRIALLSGEDRDKGAVRVGGRGGGGGGGFFG